MHVILDVSRLLLSVHRVAPSGIDRVEMAYAKRWLSLPPGDCTFAAQAPTGGFAAVPRPAVAALLDAMEAGWEGLADTRRQAWGVALRVLAGLGLGASRHALRDALAAPRRAAPGGASSSSCRTARSTKRRPSRRSAARAPPSSPSSTT